MLFRLRNMILKQDKAFSFYNGGKGLDHWSYSSTSTPFAKNIINYYFPQEVRRKFPFRYPGDFGNLVNNTVQKMLADVLYTAGRERLTDWDRSYDAAYQSELKEFHSKMPVDDKDKFGREKVLEYVEPCIKITEKAVKEIVGDNKLVCERYVDHAEKLMIKKIVGRIDYETKHTFIELKSKPPKTSKVRNKDEFKMKSQDLPEEPQIEHLTQTSFYYMVTKKIPYLLYVNDKGFKLFDQSHELMKSDHLEYLYNKMVEKILLWEKMIMFCEGDIEKLALMCEPPDMSHPFYYRDLTDDQIKLITKLWGIK